MYERFTDRARKVMQLANQQAQFYNHEWVGVEHLFLGMVREGSGISSKILMRFGVDITRAKFEIDRLVQLGPVMIIMGRLPHTPRVKNVISNAIVEARELNHSYIGTEHILLALLREEDGAVHQALVNMNLNVNDIRRTLLDVVLHDSSKSEDPKPVIDILHKRINVLKYDLNESVSMLNTLFLRIGEMLDTETAKQLTDILDKHKVPKR